MNEATKSEAPRPRGRPPGERETPGEGAASPGEQEAPAARVSPSGTVAAAPRRPEVPDAEPSLGGRESWVEMVLLGEHPRTLPGLQIDQVGPETQETYHFVAGEATRIDPRDAAYFRAHPGLRFRAPETEARRGSTATG